MLLSARLASALRKIKLAKLLRHYVDVFKVVLGKGNNSFRLFRFDWRGDLRFFWRMRAAISAQADLVRHIL